MSTPDVLVAGKWVPAQLPEGVIDAILCHCDDDEVGHEPGADGCAEQAIKASTHYCRSSTAPGKYGVTAANFDRTAPGWCSRDHYGVCSCHGSIYGTCRECGRRVKVVKVETRGTWDAFPRLPGETKATYDRRREAKFGESGVRGPLLQVMPAIAPHRFTDQDCPGAGQPPAQTRYTPGRLLAVWVKANGDERLVER